MDLLVVNGLSLSILSKNLNYLRNMLVHNVMRKIFIVFVAALMFAFGACGQNTTNSSIAEGFDGSGEMLSALRDSLQTVADRCPGELGIAVITDCGDTLLVNNQTKYPLMSVFKLHQAIALCRLFEQTGQSLDSVVAIPRSELNPDTWSPMLKDFQGSVIRVPVRELLRYTLTQSDNNASNYMFENIQSVAAVDSVIAGIIPSDSFRLRYTEADMWDNHSLCYDNCSSPLGAALLINRLFTDSIVGSDDVRFVRTTLQECRTGTDRIVAPLAALPGVHVAHKTGSGFRSPEGILAAHNDVGQVLLPGGRYYTLAILVKDFHGSEKEAAAVMADISARVYTALNKYNMQSRKQDCPES